MTEVTDRIDGARPRRFRPYPEYRGTGIEWLGEIPGHWEVVPFKRAIDYVEGPGIMATDFLDEGVPLLRISGIGGRWATLEGCNYLSPEVVRRRWSHFQVRSGDLLISGSASMGFCTEVDEGTSGAIPYTGIIIIRPGAKRALKNFVRWMLLSNVLATQVDLTRSGSTIQHYGPSHLARMRVVAPPVDEQRAIAAFLDRETARIDGLVARKERLIELLQEKRAVLITRAVTRGLDQNVPMKDSGVEWLGEIPSHWRVGKLKHACENVFVGIAEAATFAYVDQGVPMLRSTDVRANRVRTDDIRCIDIAFADRLSSKQLRTDDIVTVRTGNAGVSAVVPAAYDRGQCFTLVVSRPSRTNDSRYFCYWLNARPGQEQFTVEGVGTVQVNISVPIVENALVCIPPPEEQRAIAAFLDRETAKVDALVAKIRQAIDHLKEFRTALISAAVTGKIDVREEAS